MSRKSKVLLAMLGCVGLASAMTASTAFAVADVNAGNTTVAAELVPLNAVFQIPTVNVAYEPGGALATSTQLKVSLAGGNLDGGAVIELCLAGASLANGTVPVSPNNTSVVLTVTTPFGQGQTVSFVDNLLGSTCLAPAGLSSVNVAAGAQAGTNVDITVDNNLNPGDPDVFATDTLAQVKNQFAATITKVTSRLDFGTNQQSFIGDSPFPPFPPRTNTLNSQAALLITSDESLGNKVPVVPGSPCNSILAPGTGMNLELTGDLTGLSELDYGPGASVLIGPSDITAGKVTLLIDGPDLLICRSNDNLNDPAAIELTSPNGPNSIATGIRVSKLSLTGAGAWGAGNVNTLVNADSHDFTLDATTFFIPLIKFDLANGTDSFTKVSSSSMLPGANGVTGVILTDDGTYANCSFGTITPGTAFLIQGSDWESCVATAGKSSANLVGGTSAKVIVNAPEANVQGFTNFANQGSLQRLPMQILDANRGE